MHAAKNFNRLVALQFIVAPCLTLLFAALTPISTQAQGLAAELANDTVNAVLVLDNSGSMLANDPERLRDAGARLFMQFLKQGDALGIISFSERADIIRTLTPFMPSEIEATAAQVAKIEPTGQYTDITAAVEAAKAMVESSGRANSKSVIILLSDGKFEPSPAVGRREEILDQLILRTLPALQEKRIPVYTLAFSGDADKALLGKIAEATDAVNWFTPTSDKIHESFAELFLSVKKPQVAPMSERGFRIDPDIDEATFYVNRIPGQVVYLESPKGHVSTSEVTGEKVRWYTTEKFDVITVLTPDHGEWKLSGVNQDEGFATLLTNLKLVSSFPAAVTTGKTALLQAQLYESKLPVTLPEMANVVKYAFQISSTDKVAEPLIRDFLADDGKNGDEHANDGIFSQRIRLDHEGEYRLRVIAKSPTFERQQSIPFRVRPPVLTIEVRRDTSAVEEEAAHGEPAHHPKEVIRDEPGGPTRESVSQKDTLRIVVGDSGEFIKNPKITLTAINAKKTRYNLPVKPVNATSTGGGHEGAGMIFETSAALLPADGSYKLTASLQATNRAGKPIVEESDVVIVERTSVGVESPVEEVEVTVPTVAQPFPIMMLLMAVVGNLIIAIIGFFVLKALGKKGGSGISVPELSPDIAANLEILTKSKEIKTLQVDDPRFAEAQAS